MKKQKETFLYFVALDEILINSNIGKGQEEVYVFSLQLLDNSTIGRSLLRIVELPLLSTDIDGFIISRKLLTWMKIIIFPI